jgi:hypothetical protein
MKQKRNMFNYNLLNFEKNLFQELYTNNFDINCKDDKQNERLINLSNENIPIVRTTTIYKNKPKLFTKLEYTIIQQIKKKCQIEIDSEFNNAMIEVYTSNYSKMKFHSDQSFFFLQYLDNKNFV